MLKILLLARYLAEFRNAAVAVFPNSHFMPPFIPFFPKCVILGAAVSSSSLFEIKFRMLRRSVRPFDGSLAVAFASRGKTQEQPSRSFGVPPRSEKIANDRFAEKESFRKFAALTPLHRSSIFWQSGGKKKTIRQRQAEPCLPGGIGICSRLAGDCLTG